MSRRACRIVGLVAALLVSTWSAARAAERPVEVVIEAEADFADWQRFDLEPIATDRRPSVAERERQALLRATAVQAFVLRGYEHETEGPVDFLVDVRFAAPAAPPPGAIRWTAGRRENWLEIRLRAPDDPAVRWRGRAFNVLRRKRTANTDDHDRAIRFFAAAEAIVDRFAPRPAEAPGKGDHQKDARSQP